ncbi:sulfatase [Ruania alkalisoli]|uniref:Sulfatase n=1 Tax=Ruania alkalisoli TaxID=2779775 RepID=A0A7M1ST87_9MICO|nr:sulfatase [Ruania alkalisoli]QOR70671.1 sulfatase [Ruania alkalisoli]
MSRPNVVFIMSDDHAAHAISAYGSRINQTPHLDRLAQDGMRFDAAFCTNSICTPSRAAVLTGQHSHVNGVRSQGDQLDGRRQTFPQLLQGSDYQTALFGKWHLGHGGNADPTGFDTWSILPGQGDYVDPVLIENGAERQHTGYVTDLLTDLSLAWLDQRDQDRPFLLCLHHKAPHRWWVPADRHADLYSDDREEPETLDDDYSTRASAARRARMRIDRDLTVKDVKAEPPADLDGEDRRRWFYQRYIKDYLRCVAAVDDSVGRVLDYLDAHDLTEDTIVVYTSDQGFFLGDHGWYDKRFMYDESLRIPLLMRYPARIAAGSTSDALVQNIDFAPTFAELAGIQPSEPMNGASLTPIFDQAEPADWRAAAYYRYWEHDSIPHRVAAHCGIRTRTHKLVHYYGRGLGVPRASDTPTEPEWELFDLVADPHELHNLYGRPGHEELTAELTRTLSEVRAEIGDDSLTRPIPGAAADTSVLGAQ